MIVYKYDTETKEFLQELEINEAYGTNLPFATTIKPLAKKEGFAIHFTDTKWEYIEDNRNTTVYNKETKQESKVDYLGKIKDDVTTSKPEQFDIWEVDKWVEDIEAKNKYELQIKINEAKSYLSKTDHKFYNGYKPKADEDLVEIERLRDEARDFIRANK